MNIETINQPINVTKLVGKEKKTKVIEGDISVPDIKPDILSLISVDNEVFITNQRIENGKLIVDGTMQVCVVYMSDDESGAFKNLTSNFDFSETFAAGAITVYQTTASGSVRLQKPTASNSSYIVEKVTKATTKDGDITEQIYVCGANGYESYVISGTYYDAIKKVGKIPAPGDIVRFTLNSVGEITSIARDVEFNGKKLKVNYGVDDIRTSVVNIFTYVSGNVFKKTDSGFVLLTDNYPGSSYANMGEEALTVYRFSSNNVTIIYDTKTGKVRRGRISDIKDAGSVGFENASYICSRVNYLSAMVTFVYE